MLVDDLPLAYAARCLAARAASCTALLLAAGGLIGLGSLGPPNSAAMGYLAQLKLERTLISSSP